MPATFPPSTAFDPGPGGQSAPANGTGYTIAAKGVLRWVLAIITHNGVQTVWTLNHNLNNPTPILPPMFDAAGNAMTIDWKIVDANNVMMTFQNAESNGTVYNVPIGG